MPTASCDWACPQHWVRPWQEGWSCPLYGLFGAVGSEREGDSCHSDALTLYHVRMFHTQTVLRVMMVTNNQ